MIKINNEGIISKKIITDELVNSQGDKYLTDADLGGVSGSLEDMLNTAVQEATEAAINAQTLAEAAAVNALEIETSIATRAEEMISQITTDAINAQTLAETAAVNALETEQRLEETATERIEEVAENVTFDSQIIAETAAINALVYLEEARAILEEIKGLQQS